MKNLLVVLSVVSALNCFGQYHVPSHSSIHFQNKPMGFITALPPAPPGAEGSFYVYDEWNRTDIYMKDSTKISDVNVRIDLKAEQLEIQFFKEIKVLPVSKVLGISMEKNNGDKEEFVNGISYDIAGGVYNNRLLQVIHEGQVTLLCRIQPEVIRASGNPNPMLDVGRKDDKIVFKKKYLIVKGKDFVEAEMSRSKFKEEMARIFGREVESILKKKNFKKEEDLVVLVRELNERYKS